MPKQLIVKGHTLPHEGRTLSGSGWWRNGHGFTHCSCGEMSPMLESTTKRQQWHREHKLAVLNKQNNVATR